MSSVSVLGKKVYIGIDVHKTTYSLTAICEKTVVKKATIDANPRYLPKMLKRWFDGALEINTAYEAGFSGFTLHRNMVANGIRNIVVNPASIAIAANDKVKTDLRDSKKIAIELADDRLTGIYIPTEEEQSDRILSRTREQIADHRGRVARQIKSCLDFDGSKERDQKRSISFRYIRELEASLEPKLLRSLQHLFSLWGFLTRQLLEFRKIFRQGRPDQPEKQSIQDIYKSVPGVGDISSRVFTDELGDMSRFKNASAISHYLGLTPAEYSSGDNVRRGNITRQGSPRLRKLLVEVAWRAIKIDPSLKIFFDRIARRRGQKRAIVATARHIAVRMRACLRVRKRYELNKEQGPQDTENLREHNKKNTTPIRTRTIKD